jgi:hypothetical protein
LNCPKKFNKFSVRAFTCPRKGATGKEANVSLPTRNPFNRPRDVVDHPAIMPEVKRMILASWASDRFAVESQPALRRPPELPHPVPVDEVLAALRQLEPPGEGEQLR